MAAAEELDDLVSQARVLSVRGGEVGAFADAFLRVHARLSPAGNGVAGVVPKGFRGRYILEPQTGVPVFARSEWIERKHGRVVIYDLVWLDGEPQAVGAVWHTAKNGNGNGVGGRP
jgi:hypothetical protein